MLVPHLKNRPFTMKRYPDGIEGKHFFQKDAPKHMPDWIPTRTFPSTSRATGEPRTIAYPLVNDELALLWMVNMGCIDMNCWYSRVDKPDRPDFCLFDLDPSDDVGFREVGRRSRCSIKELLDGLGLEGLPKTSGADGMHVLVPVTRRHTYADTRVVRGDRRRHARPRLSRARHDRVVEGEAPRRADRREPERRGEDDRVGLLGPARARRDRLGAARLGRGDRGARSTRLHDGRRCSAESSGTATSSSRVLHGEAVARRRTGCAHISRRLY